MKLKERYEKLKDFTERELIRIPAKEQKRKDNYRTKIIDEYYNIIK